MTICLTHLQIEEGLFGMGMDEAGWRNGEALVSIYNRFAQLINDLERNGIKFPKVTVNTKFLNCLQPEWLKYVTQVRLVKRLTEDSYDDLFDYLSQYEKLINASRAKKLEKSHDPLALVAHTGSSSRTSSSYYVTHPSSIVDYDDDYQGDTLQNNHEDPLTSAMILLARAITQRYYNPTNNRLRTSSNTINQAIVQADRINIQSRNSGNDGRNTRRSYVQEEIIEGNNVQNDVGNTQRTLRTTSSGSAANVQCYNCSEKGHYACNCPKPRVRDSKYFMEQMLLAKQDEAGVTLTDEHNDFLVVDASWMEEIEELSVNICLMARIQPANIDSNAGPSYDYAFLSEVQTSSTNYVNPLVAKDNQEQKYPKQPKILNDTFGDDQIDRNIIFDEPNVDVNSGSVEYDKNIQESYKLEQLARNAYKEAEKQQIIAKKQIEELQKTQTILKRKMSENEDKYHDIVLDLEARAKKNEDVVLKIDSSNASSPSSSSEIKPTVAPMPSANLMKIDLKKMENEFKTLFALLQTNSKRESIFYTSPEEIQLTKFCQQEVKPILHKLHLNFEIFQNRFLKDIKEMKDVFESTESDFNATWTQNKLLNDQLLEAKLKHEIECCVLLSHECVNNKVQDEIEKIQRDSIEIQERRQKRINILENDVQRCQKQSLDFELQIQHEKERRKYESSLKTVCETSWISKMEKPENENASLEFKVQYLINEQENIKLEYQKLFDLIKKTRSQSQGEINELIEHVTQKTYAYAEVRAQNQDLLITISELKTKLKNVEKGKSVNTKFDKNNVVQIVLWIVDSGCSKHMTGDRSLLKNFVEKFMSTVRFGNDHFAAIIGYGDYVQGNLCRL
ncbi:retrovirus-related pol polyprotein from transposon TNT 1-94 [Tanacetum coccineum]